MFDWTEDYSVKVEVIDDQHKRLFEIGENINELLQDYSGADSFDEIMTNVEELSEYTKYHFEEEEKLMQLHGYTDLEKHKVEHKKFISYLDKLDVDQIDENQEETLKKLINFIAIWIFKHISNVDFKYSDLIAGNIANA